LVIDSLILSCLIYENLFNVNAKDAGPYRARKAIAAYN